MTSHANSQVLRFRGPVVGRPSAIALRSAPAAAVLLLVSAAAVALSQSAAVSLRMALAAGLGLLVILTLAVLRYDAAIVLGMVLLGVVRSEPAPPDAILGIAMAVGVATGRFRLRAVPRTVRHLLGALVALNLLSVIDVVDFGAGARYLLITLYLVAFSVWLAGYVDSRRRTRLVVGAYVVAAVSSAVLGTLALFLTFPGSTTLNANGYRAEALFKDPNVFGPFLVSAAVIVLDERLRPGLFARRTILSSLCLVALAAGILFAYSRAAWINLVVAAMVLTLLRARGRGGGRRLLRVAMFTIVAVVVAVALVDATGSAGFLAQRANSQGYDTDRFNAQRTGVKLALDHPVGIGPGQFEVRVPLAAHSLYVRTLAEQGIGGLVVMLALVGGTLGLAARNAARGYDLYGLSSAALLAAWCGTLVNSVVVDTLHWRHLWLLAALIWACAMLNRAPGRGAHAPRPARFRPSASSPPHPGG